MARLTAATRNALPDSAFAGPNRSYPEQDPAHAADAKAMAARFAPPALKAKVDAKANKVLGNSAPAAPTPYPPIKQKPSKYNTDNDLPLNAKRKGRGFQ